MFLNTTLLTQLVKRNITLLLLLLLLIVQAILLKNKMEFLSWNLETYETISTS